MQETKRERIPQLDGMRVFMIGLIVLSHMGFLVKYSYGEIWSKYLLNTTMAVDYFFALSGFGLMYSAKDIDSKITPISSVKFAINKIKKIYPIYILSLIIMIPYIVVYLMSGDSVKSIITKLVIYLFLDVLLCQSLFGTKILSHSINSVCWFLSTLFVSYIFSPILIKFVNKKIQSIKKCLISIVAVSGIILFLNKVFDFIQNNVVIKGVEFDGLVGYTPYTRIWYLLLGMVICQLYLLIKDSKYSAKVNQILSKLWMIIWTAVVVYYFARTTIGTSLGANSILVKSIDLIICIGVFSSLIFGKNPISRFLGNKVLTRMGKEVMYVFLLHYPVRFYVEEFWPNLKLGNYTGIVQLVVVILLSILLSLIVSNIHTKVSRRKINE